MRAERFGSYSTAVTVPDTPSLLRLKSISRSSRLLPPPRWRVVIRPWLLRPPERMSDTVSDFSGRFFVISSKVYPEAPRRPGDVGLNCLIGTALYSCRLDARKELDLLTGLEGHDRLFP